MKVLSLFLFVKTTALLMTLLSFSAASHRITSFDSKLGYAILRKNPHKNIIFSPISVKTCLALAYLGAEGNTASELQKTLQLSGGANKKDVAREFSTIFNKTKSSSKSCEDPILKIVNRVYINNKFYIAKRYNKLAIKYLNAKAEPINLQRAEETVNRINKWVEAKTNHKIKNIVTRDIFDSNSEAVLVNAIYFKATWSNAFDKSDTKLQSFALSSTRKVKVKMMEQSNQFLYGKLKDLNATAIEMGYLNTDITMLIILPNRVDGLSALEAQLQNVNIVGLTDQLYSLEGRVQLPKFKFEYDISLVPILRKLGIRTMFSNAADFSSLLGTKQRMSFTYVKHKAFISVDENGTEAAAATVGGSFRMLDSYNFVADHPFFFAIKDKKTVYFAGHVTNP